MLLLNENAAIRVLVEAFLEDRVAKFFRGLAWHSSLLIRERTTGCDTIEPVDNHKARIFFGLLPQQARLRLFLLILGERDWHNDLG